MSRNGPEWSSLNWEQLCAAYADGELNPATRARFRRQLAESPELLAKLADQRAFAAADFDLWHSIRPDPPTNDAWSRAWNNITAGLDAPSPTPRRSLGRRLALSAVVALAAAIVFAFTALVAWKRPTESLNDNLPGASTVEVFVVATSDDVEIHSVRDDDVAQLVVGAAPFSFPMTLAIAGDVRLDGIGPANDGMMPEVQMGWTDAPMVYAPSQRGP